MKLPRNRSRIALVLSVVAALLLAACGGDDDGDAGEDTASTGDTSSDTATEDTATEAAAGETGSDDVEMAGGECQSVNIGWIPWDEDIAVTNLWEHILEEQGLEVEQTQLEVGGIYAGLAEGDLDLFLDAWLPTTHEDYMEQFGDSLVDLGVWFEEAPLTWAVPTSLAENDGITSIEDLQDNADMFGGQIIGIEPGAGLTRISREQVIPAYGLDDSFELVEGSTPAMLSALGDAVEGNEPIVVTLWQPHFAYGEWDLTNLEDPENALGDPEQIHMMARPGFEEDCPQVAEMLGGFTMTNDQIASLEVAINGADDPMAGVEQWVSENQDDVSEWSGA